MMIYVDNEFRCYTENAEGRTPIETEYFNGKCKRFIEGYRYVPEGRTWIRDDGESFHGEMISCHEDIDFLREIQSVYEEGLDMRKALEVLEVIP